MAIHDYAATEAHIPEGTLARLFLESVDRFGNEAALARPVGEEWHPISYREVFADVKAVAGGLRAVGVEPGERAAILSENRPEWALADFGCLCAGVVDVPIYATLTAPQIQYILNDSEARAIFLSTAEQLEKVLEIRPDCAALETIVVFDPPQDVPDGVIGWDGFLELGRTAMKDVTDDAFREGARSITPDEVATVLYTSGTTGDPKGVELTHNNLYSNVNAAGRLLPVGTEDSTLSFLPLSHVLQRMVDYLFFSSGCMIAYGRSMALVAEDLGIVKPTIVVSVPRLYEKVYSKVLEAGGLKGRLARWAIRVAEEWSDEEVAGREPGPLLKARHRIADRLVFRKIRERVGGRLRFFVSGGGPLAPEINRFFRGAGVMILEGYGLTETSPVTNVNTPEHFRFGTVGRPVPGTEVRIAEDGEILIRGPQVMKGYFRRPEATAEVMTEDGWFRTGDIGEIDRDGFLRITDRKKDIIVTAGGKNVAPQPIENRLQRNRYVDQAVLIGDRRKFLSLLVVPSFAALEAWAGERGIETSDAKGLLAESAVQALMEEQVLGELQDLARFELPKKIVLIEREFTIEDGSLTPSQKVKRRVVEERYREVIDSLYRDEAFEQTVFVAA